MLWRADAAAAQLSADVTPPDQGMTLLAALDRATLSRDGRPPTGLAFALPRGTRLDLRARERLCSSTQAQRGACPKASKIGFGGAATVVTGFLAPGGETEVSWSITAYLGTPARAGDAASIILRTELLGADRVEQLLTPALGAAVPATSILRGRVRVRGSGRYGLELTFPGWPGSLVVPASMSTTPTRLDLQLGAVRRVRQDFVRHVRVRTRTGFRMRRIPDHRLVGYDLLRAPRSCSGGWPYELRLDHGAAVTRTPVRMRCPEET